ncbi:periphilin-1 [Cheilinus undulatus]|uniref:periphilin-1 n=1 Tax=Cheilinus undulatus TaxID=241271 RepID=UPI001BD30B80|nr:periphilin-1 [Cheilinus undulatus]
MDHTSTQDAHQSKGSLSRHREHSDEALDMRPTDSSVPPSQDEKRVIRRVRSPSRPRAWQSNSYKPKFGGRYYKPRLPRDDNSFYKPGFSYHKYHHSSHRGYFPRRDYLKPKPYHPELRERERERENERYEQKKSAEGDSPPKQNTSRPFLPRTSSSRDKDTQFSVFHSDRNQSKEKDHRGSRSSERERSRERDLPTSTASQTMARDRAIQQKRREIDEVYYQECEMFGLVAKMLIAKDQSLEGPIQSSLQENLRDIGKRCVEAMEKFIEDYDSRELSH